MTDDLQAFGVHASYTVVVDPEFPGDGDWGCRTPRWAVDDLRVERSSPAGIVCSCDNSGGTLTIELDPTTGRQTAGTRLDSF